MDSNNGIDFLNDGLEVIVLIFNGFVFGKIIILILFVIFFSELFDEIIYNIYEVECIIGLDEFLVFLNMELLNGLI